MDDQWFSTNKHDDFVYTITDLVKLPWLGGREMATFRIRWDSVVEALTDKLSDETLAELLASKMEQSGELKDDMSHYYSVPVGHVDHTYRYLRDALDRCLFRRQQKKNSEEHARALSHTGGERPRDSHDRSANLC